MRLFVTAAVILAALVCFAGSAAADNPKSYNIKFTSTTHVGSHQFEAGDYELLVHGHDSQVVVSDRNGNEVPVEAKVEAGNEKFGQTAVLVNTAEGTRRVTEIRLGGSKNRVAFQP